MVDGGRGLLREVRVLPDVDGGCCVRYPCFVEEHAHSSGGCFEFVRPVGDEGAGEGCETLGVVSWGILGWSEEGKRAPEGTEPGAGGVTLLQWLS